MPRKERATAGGQADIATGYTPSFLFPWSWVWVGEVRPLLCVSRTCAAPSRGAHCRARWCSASPAPVRRPHLCGV